MVCFHRFSNNNGHNNNSNDSDNNHIQKNKNIESESVTKPWIQAQHSKEKGNRSPPLLQADAVSEGDDGEDNSEKLSGRGDRRARQRIKGGDRVVDEELAARCRQ